MASQDRSRPDQGATLKGLWRQAIGRDSPSLRSVFRALRAESEARGALIDVSEGVFFARVPLDPEDGTGTWRFLSIREEIFCIITECVYSDDRLEVVRDEGFVEFHFQLEGPVSMSLPGASQAGRNREVNEATLLACRSAGDVSYAVRFPRGAYRIMGVYVDPQLLRRSFAFRSAAADRLIAPLPGETTLVERKIDFEFVRLLQHLRDLPFESGRDLMRAVARLTELICLTTDAIDAGSEEGAQFFSARDLEMFEAARTILATDFSQDWSATSLARRLGTNATKLKSGFKFLYGKTIFDYRKVYRMNHAMALLSQRGMSVAEVALAVGYERQASFTLAFKSHFGLLPKTARHLSREPPRDG